PVDGDGDGTAICDIGAYEFQPQAVWSDVCVPHRIEITGVGMGDRYHTVNPQTLSLADPSSVNWLLAQVSGRDRTTIDVPIPSMVTLSSDMPQTIMLPLPSGLSNGGYAFESDMYPTGLITAQVDNPGDSYRTPRALVLYSKRNMPHEWTSVGRTLNEYVYWPRPYHTYTEVLTIPPLDRARTLYVTAVVIDNDDDARPMVLEATAGGVVESVSGLGPTDGDGLNIVNLTLQQVPAGTSQVSVILRSPSGNGDSLVLVGLNVSHPCSDATPTLRGVVDMQGRPARPAPSWAIPLTVWLTPAGGGTPDYTLTTTADQNGEFELYLDGITPGLYDVGVKGDHTLRNLAPNVSLVAGDNAIFLGTLLEGDVETVTTYNQVQQADANALAGSFNQCQGDPTFAANTDLDASGCVLLADFGLLSGNFGQEGDIVVTPTTSLPAGLPQASGGALMTFGLDETAVTVGEVVTLALVIDPRGEPVNGGMVHLSFDPSLVEVVAVTLTERLPVLLEQPLVDNQQGVVRFAAGVLGQTLSEEFPIATLSLRVKAATAGTTITPVDVFPATSVSGPEGSILAEARGITLRTETQEEAEYSIYLPIIMH
ncbi:MAG: cohesin domain-containing protein, partial [Anaerolineae bacterium]